jgi:hypothetical protein
MRCQVFNLRRFVLVIGMVGLCGVLAYRAWSAEPKGGDAKEESFGTRYARLRLRMAEVALDKAKQMNQKVPGTLPADLMSQFSQDVSVAKVQLQNSTRADGGDLLLGWIARAEMTLNDAKMKLNSATRTEQRTPGTYEPIDIERLRLSAELAQLQLDRGKSLIDASADAKLQWIVDMVDDELLRLKKQSALLFQTRGPSDL